MHSNVLKSFVQRQAQIDASRASGSGGFYLFLLLGVLTILLAFALGVVASNLVP